MNVRLLIVSVALLLAACGGGGSAVNPPVTLSNLQYSPTAANATLGTISVSGSADFSSGADLASLRITDSNGTNSTTPISAPGLRAGRITIPATTIPGNPVGFYRFSVWLRDAAGTDSNKLDGQIEIKRVPPQANAGPDAVTYLNAPLTLDGSASTNVNGTPTKYAWNITTLPSTGTVTLSGSNTATTNFTCSVQGIFDLRLLIDDGIGQSAPDSVAVSCIRDSSFTLNSSEADVRRLAGSPTAIPTINSNTYYAWEYGNLLTYVRFSKSTRKVIAWRSYDILLPTVMPFREVVAGASLIAIGSTKDDVARIQGTPIAVNGADDSSSFYDQWSYDKSGLTYIRFSKATGLVTEYRNYDGSLKV